MDGGTNLEHNITNAGDFIFPGASDRTLNIGRTGSGKTYFGMWLLSYQSFDRMPWVVVDYKRETLFRQLGKGAFRSYLKPSSPAPTRPGLHLIQPLESDDEAMDDFFWNVWKRGRCGIFIDEAMMVPGGRGSAIRAILTQGRSLKIPIIANTQRPVELDRFFFSESQYFAAFRLIDRDDRLTLRRYTGADPDFQPDQFCCRWYDTKNEKTLDLRPRGESSTFLERIRNKAPKRFWFDL